MLFRSEIINSKGKVDTANNNANFHQGKYKLVIWDRLTDSNNWFLTDYSMQKEYLLWWNREPNQFFQDKDSNTMVAIYLGYYRVGTGWDDFSEMLGHLKQGELLGTPSGTISSRALQECNEGSETREYRLEQTMNLHERLASDFSDDDIVRTAMQIAEESDKELVR